METADEVWGQTCLKNLALQHVGTVEACCGDPLVVGCKGIQGDLVSRLIMGINGVTIWVIGVINLLTKSP